jgi:hypothetical protein
MSVNVRVEKSLEFVTGAATRQANVIGPLQEKKKHFQDHFTDDDLDTFRWAVSVPGSSDSIAISEVAGGECLITTGTVDDDSCMIAGAIIWNGSKNATCAARITIDDVSGTGLFVGFSDAKSESNNSIAVHYPADVLTTVASTAVGFVIDADHATSSIMCATVNGDTDGTPVDTGVDWADGETRDLRVSIDTAGKAIFYINGAPVAQVASAVTAATLLCFTVQAITRANDGANTVQFRRLDVWGDET